MPLLRDLSFPVLGKALSGDGLPLQIGPYVYRLHSNIPVVSKGLRTLYADFPLAQADQFIDFEISLLQRGLVQRLTGGAEFLFDQQSPFDAMDAKQCYAFLEWGMNWCVSIHMNEYLKLHAAVVARNGAGVIMPGVPGAGKSTLCAALSLRGWRVLSDEHALIPPMTTELVPLYRPVSLKNESIEAIRAFSPDAVFGPESSNTHKGTVVHLKADLAQDSHDDAPVPAKVMVFPQFSTEEPQSLLQRPRTASFVLAAYHSFNYSLMGVDGFHAMRHLIENVACYDLVYSDLDWAVQAMESLLA
ncbi:MAG: HprK-related kinase A [Halioglobus sp.]|nr:HprK-related kinase A [Halioglobus sp.]